MRITHRRAGRRINLALGQALAIGLMTFAVAASAATYYVDVDWGGPYNGKTNEPYKTIKAAVDAAGTSAAPRIVYIAAGTYADVANGGTEDYSVGGGSDHGILITNVMTVAGGYAGWQGGTTFDWTTRTSRASIIDLQAAASRAFRHEPPSGGALFDGLTFQNANHTGTGGTIYSPYAYDRKLYVTNCLFSTNVTTSSGGALYIQSQFPASWVRNSDFVGNQATTNGGAVATYLQSGSLTVEDCTFVSNVATGTSATGRGGAIYWDGNAGAASTVRRCRFEGNQAVAFGGAVFSTDPRILFENCVFTSNSAPSGSAVGGKVYWCGAYSLQNCLVYGNTGGYALQSEGARIFGSYTLDLLHCTVVSNLGGGVRAQFDDTGTGNKPLRVRNSIVANNGQYGLYRSADDYVLFNNNFYSNTVGNYYNCTTDVTSISVDPVFINAATRDYRLAITSPSIEAGTNNTGLTIDLLGTMRPTRNGWDQGCYEERGACRIIHQAPVITASNVTLRGQLVYDGGSNDANVTIYWGAVDGGKTNTDWANPAVIGYVTNGGNFQVTITPPSGTTWFRCYATNWYDGVWADASESFDFVGGSAVAIWTGASTNALASNPNNWFSGAVPQPQDTAKFDSSPSNCTWDAAAPESVTRWEQTALYAGTVTVARGWASGVTVSNDMLIRGGRLTHAANSTQETYRLRFAVGGNFEVGSAAAIDVDGKGYAKGKGPGAGTADLRGATHGGEGYRATAACYGSVWEPVTLGSGGGGSSGRTGGGAVYLTVGGTATVSGVISANGDGGLVNYGYGGAGGSVFLFAGRVAGSGTIRANGSGAGYDASCGGGGRVAVIVTNDTSFAGLTLTAFGLYGDYYGRSSAAGTVYKESTAHAPQRGILVLDNNGVFTRRARTVIPAAHPLELFSEIVINRAAVLGFDTGDTFDFGSLGNLTFNGPANSFIAVRDLTGITFPASYTITNYTLRLDAPLTQTANWIIATNGSLSHSPYDGSGEVGLDLTLNGNLTVEGTIDVRRSGYLNASEDSASRGPGFSNGAAGSHGGLGSGAPAGLCYGSILNPAHFGSGAGSGGNVGGGRCHLVVSGNTAVIGSILTGCLPTDAMNAAGGSLDLQTATLSGSGTISSTGGRTVNPGPTHSEIGGGGGRIRVKLTASDSFGNVIFAANGGGAGAGSPASLGAAGTIYLEGAGVTSGGGRIIIANANLNKNRATEFPPLLLNSDDLRRATLIVTNGAWVNLTRSLRIGDLRLSANSQFNLNGYTCTVSQASHSFDGTLNGPGIVQWINPGSIYTLR